MTGSTSMTRSSYIMFISVRTHIYILFLGGFKHALFGHTIKDGGCELVKCVILRKVHGKRRRGIPMTSYSGNIAQRMDGSME